MKKVFLAGFCLFGAFLSQAQIKAVTETGDEVILNDNGTWKYVSDLKKSDDVKVIPLNKQIFKRSSSSSFLVKSKKVDIGIWINPKEWSFTKGEEKDDAEFEFQKKGEDLYAMLISEKLQIPILTLRNIAEDNARKAAPDIKVTKEEYRIVNGVQVLMLQMRGTIQGLKFVYNGYYYSNENGTIQLLTYTGENLMDEFQSDIDGFLNGLIEIKE